MQGSYGSHERSYLGSDAGGRAFVFGASPALKATIVQSVPQNKAGDTLKFNTPDQRFDLSRPGSGGAVIFGMGASQMIPPQHPAQPASRLTYGTHELHQQSSAVQSHVYSNFPGSSGQGFFLSQAVFADPDPPPVYPAVFSHFQIQKVPQPLQAQLLARGKLTATITLLGGAIGTTPYPLTLDPYQIDGSGVLLAWPAIAGAVSYNVYQNRVLIGNTTGLQYTVSGLVVDTAYLFNVTAVAPSGKETQDSLDRTVQFSSTTATVNYMTRIKPFPSTGYN